MKKISIILIIVAILTIGIIGFFISGLNRVVTMDEEIKSAWAQVENQIQRRADLIPNLVSTVKGYAKHEEQIFTQIAEARAKLAGTISSNKSIGEKIDTIKEFEGALSRLLVIIEQYPNLKADRNFIQLQDELAGTENRIAVERMRYNNKVEAFNAHIRRIPGNWFASIKNLGPAVYFKVEEKVKAVPEVKF